jgi:ribosomal-protein-serine acetyltransferase
MSVLGLHPHPLPEFISSPRLVLKRHEESVAPKMFQTVQDERARLSKHLSWIESVRTIADMKLYLELTDGAWQRDHAFEYGIFRKSDTEYLGNMMVHTISWPNRRCELGYWITEKAEGQRYISEAARALESHLFQAGFHRIEIRCSTENQRSAYIPKSCGYHLEGELKEDSIENGKYRNTLLFAKLAPYRSPV